MSARTISFDMVGISPYSQSRFHDAPALEKEGRDEYDARTWREKAHFDRRGHVFIPPMGVKQALSEAAKRLQIRIPGKGKATYTKNVQAGIMFTSPAFVHVDGAPFLKEHLTSEAIHANADGKRGSGSRVIRRFPMIPDGWTAHVDGIILDAEIPEDVIRTCLSEAGSLIGIGRFRPQNGGYLGRFEVARFAIGQLIREAA